uniref:Uncharacterized protein n=1 Tax=Oryza nivara TaxID=4536 RepID=A0A0E0FLF8_ORYNI
MRLRGDLARRTAWERERSMRRRGRRRCRCCVSKSTGNIVGRLILIQRLEEKKVTWKHQNSENCY